MKRLVLTLGRALRLRCPACGRGPLFRNWISMHPHCAHCGLPFERESGFYLGSIYVNYGLTGLIVAVLFPILVFGRGLNQQTVLFAAATFVLLFPLWFFRYARSIWLAFDQFIDPVATSPKDQGASPRD